jgi:hypothetical protein
MDFLVDERLAGELLSRVNALSSGKQSGLSARMEVKKASVSGHLGK